MNVTRRKAAAALLFALIFGVWAARAQQSAGGPGNRAERLEWFRDLGFGMFVHWNVDGTLGGVISHSMVGASEDYLKRYVEQLPKMFDPRRYDPEEWASLAMLAGMRYVVFTTKHHAGFCMFPTRTTDFNVMNTPYGKDVTAQLVKAFRAQGIAVGFYYSPDDFLWLYRRGKPVARAPHPGVTPQENEELLAYDRAQLRELLTNYGPIDIMFLDGPAEGLRELCWELQPDIVVTRGAIATPEQHVPGLPIDGAWESCVTMGTEWPYKPTNETYKSGQELIRMLIETRAKGGNLLLNVGPKPDGTLPAEQEDRLRELALWNFVNRESIEGVRPWLVTNEGDVWFTRKGDTVYAIVTGEWKYGEPKTVTLKSVAADGRAVVSVLGHGGEILEYKPDVKPRVTWRQTAGGLEITAWKAHRLYTDNRWPNPVALKIAGAKPGITRPAVTTLGARWDATRRRATLRGDLTDLGGAAGVEVGFEYRVKPEATEFNERGWEPTGLAPRSAPGGFAAEIGGLEEGRQYEIRAVVKHPLLTAAGAAAVLTVPPAGTTR